MMAITDLIRKRPKIVAVLITTVMHDISYFTRLIGKLGATIESGGK